MTAVFVEVERTRSHILSQRLNRTLHLREHLIIVSSMEQYGSSQVNGTKTARKERLSGSWFGLDTLEPDKRQDRRKAESRDVMAVRVSRKGKKKGRCDCSQST